MGGYGSGRWYRYYSKATTESQLGINVLWMKQQGFLELGSTGTLRWSQNGQETGSIRYKTRERCVIFSYKYRPDQTKDWEPVEQCVSLDQISF